MSLQLDRGTVPKGLSVKTMGFNTDVHIGNDVITTRSLLIGVFHELTERKLVARDPRPQFARGVASMQEQPGFGTGQHRLVPTEKIMRKDELTNINISYQEMLRKVAADPLASGIGRRQSEGRAAMAAKMWQVMSRSDYEESEDYQISLEDLLATTAYVLTNTDLFGETDDRLQFVESMRTAEERDEHLVFSKAPVFVSQ